MSTATRTPIETTDLTYFTTDTLSLAAYLMSEGYALSHHESCQVIEPNKNGEDTLRDKTVFYFKADNWSVGTIDYYESCNELAEDFRKGKAFGNINRYEFYRRELMGIIKKNGEERK